MILKTVPAFFDTWYSFQNTTVFIKNASWGVDFIFLIPLGNDINRISTSKMTVLKYT